jgi:hypothetical protein
MYVVEGCKRIPILLTLAQMLFYATTNNPIKVIVANLLQYGNLFKIDMTSKLTNFGIDGVSIFQGAKNGLIPHLKEKHVPFMLWVHYVAHQTNLVIQTLSRLPLIFKIEALLKSMYNYYCTPP